MFNPAMRQHFFNTIASLLLVTLPSLAQIQLDISPDTEEEQTPPDNTSFFIPQSPTGTQQPPAPFPPSAQQAMTYSGPFTGLSENMEPVFGAHLFQGAFRDISFTGFNPFYQIAIGDTIQLMLWGSIRLQVDLTVDPQGNIFIPEVGPVKVAGTKNADLNELISERIKSVFKDTVQSYAVLAAAQPVKVFVTGAVNRPGLYGGFSSDSVLYFLDKAGGIDLDEGSFIDISVIRGDNSVENVNLYKFLVNGEMNLMQFSDGDRILVKPLRYTVSFDGAVRNAYRFEFSTPEIPVEEALALAQPEPTATHLSVESENNGLRTAAYYPINEVKGVLLNPSDKVTVSRELKPGTILVTIEGENEGSDQQVHTYGATLGDAIARIRPSPLANMDALQLYRISVADRQKKRIEESLENLERNILNARSDSVEEARIRSEEAKLILQFIERARDVEPKGHVILGGRPAESKVVLEDGDVIFVPAKSNLIAVHGQVVYPTTQVWKEDMSVKDYIIKSGGLTENADKDKILIVKANGVVQDLEATGHSYRYYEPTPGEEIIILPKPDTKTLQFAKDITTILYQIAIATSVALRI